MRVYIVVIIVLFSSAIQYNIICAHVNRKCIRSKHTQIHIIYAKQLYGLHNIHSFDRDTKIYD